MVTARSTFFSYFLNSAGAIERRESERLYDWQQELRASPKHNAMRTTRRLLPAAAKNTISSASAVSVEPSAHVGGYTRRGATLGLWSRGT